MPKLGFLLSTMHVQEGSRKRKILHAYVRWNLRVHKLKSRYTRARTSLCTHEYRLHAQEYVCACRLKSAHARMNIERCSSTFLNFS